MLKKIRLIHAIVAAVMLLPLSARAQTAVASAGGDAHGAGTISYTVGQTFYQTPSSYSGSISEGVQHTYSITEVSVGGVSAAKEFNIKVFPNPTTDKIILRNGSLTSNNIKYTLTDQTGRTISTGQSDQTDTYIDMSSTAPSMYFLRVTSNGQHLGTFKIIKQ
ncbi:MAG: T9SS type A sorting domain-containing protein [Bacteroidales bacterium]|nr:T9SS type A sorting domain-containing protein [Bacteroidales bacterium]